MTLLATLDGTMHDPDTPLLAADDLGLLRGEGVFETTLMRQQTVRQQAAHLQRMRHSAEMLQLDLPEPDRWQRGIDAVTAAWRDQHGPDKEMVLRLVATKGREPGTDGSPTAPQCLVLGSELSPAVGRARQHGITLRTLERGIDTGLAQRAPWLLLGAKSLSYAINMAATRYAKDAGADDALFVASDGTLLEGPTSSLVIASDGVLLSTPHSFGILPGLTQQGLFEQAEKAGWATDYRALRREDVLAADGAWFVSSVRLAVRVSAMDGTSVPDSGLTEQVQGLLEQVR